MNTRKAEYEKAIKQLETAMRTMERIGRNFQDDFDADRIADHIEDLVHNRDSGLRRLVAEMDD